MKTTITQIRPRTVADADPALEAAFAWAEERPDERGLVNLLTAFVAGARYERDRLSKEARDDS